MLASTKLLFFAALTSAEFTKQTFKEDTFACNASLTTSVPNVCRARVYTGGKYEVWSKNLDFQFGKISKAEWQKLRDQYTAPWAGNEILSGSTQLFGKYDASRSYNLKDFLPVPIRALSDNLFAEERLALPNEPIPSPPAPKLYNQSVLVPNCWGTVFETARSVLQGQADDTSLYYDVYSTDDKLAQDWMNATTTAVSGPFESAKRQFGDAMFIFLQDSAMQRPVLEHNIFFIDNDIIFEKAGTGDKNPFRITNIATVEREWKPSTQGGLFRWELRRPKQGVSAKSFTEQFSLLAEPTDSRWPEFWEWPKDDQRNLSLAVADNPRKPGEIDGLTLLSARRYEFCQMSNQDWKICGF